MRNWSTEDYERAFAEVTGQAADEFRRSAASEQGQRSVICRFFRRGADAGFSHSELIDFLGVSSPSVMEMAGYSDEAAQRVMETLAGITDEEIQSARL